MCKSAVHIHVLEGLYFSAGFGGGLSLFNFEAGFGAFVTLRDQALPRRLHDSPISDESKKEPDSKQVGVH